MNYIDKLNEIISLLINETKFKDYQINKKAVYWKMGTSFFTMFDRLYENIKDKDISYSIKVFLDQNHKTTERKNKAYQLKLNNENITPCKVRGYVSDSAIHQYMRAITGFGLGVVETKHKNLKDFVESNGEIKLVSNIISKIETKNRINLIIEIISSSLFSNVQFQRNISYSILIETLIAFNFSFRNLEINNQMFSFNRTIGKRNEKTIKFASLITDIELIKNDIQRMGTIATYKEIIDCIKENYSSIELFINNIWFEYNQKLNDDETLLNIQKHIEVNNLINQLKLKRNQFKNNIFYDRKSKGLILSKSDLYSDIVLLNNSSEDLLSKFNESEAAHIYEYKSIKQKLISNPNNELFDYVCNPNNGIMMKHEYHKSFDRRQWFFDINGQMIIPEENQEYLLNILKLKKIKIKDTIFNDDMKRFLLMRQ